MLHTIFDTLTNNHSRPRLKESSYLFSRKQHQIISQLSLMVLSSNSILEVQKFILDKLVQNMQSPYVIIGRKLDDTDQILLHTKRHDLLGTKILAIGNGLNQRSAENRTLDHKHPIFISDLKKTQFKPPSFFIPELQRQIRSGIIVPLRNEVKSMGFLSIYSRKPHNFQQYDLDFMRSIGQLLSVAINRMEVERQLIRYKERLDLAQTANYTGVFEWNMISDMIWWSKGEEKLFKIPENTFGDNYRDRKTFRYWKERLHPEDHERVSQEIRNAIAAHETDYENKFRIIYPNGIERWIKAVANIYYDSNQQPIRLLGVNYDITNQHKQEQRKDAFISMASHELKTPLTSIKAFNQMILRKLNTGRIPQEDLEMYLEKIDYQINKLSLLISELLDVTRINQGKMTMILEKFNLTLQLEEIIETIGQSHSSHRLVLTAPAHLIIEGDPNRIEQAIINLLTNAIKYSPGKEKVEVELKQDENDVLLSVKDYGIGIPVSQQDQIGQRFFRVEGRDEEKFPGMGIGLYIAYQIVRQHQGQIWFKSEENHGTTFFISLPVSRK